MKIKIIKFFFSKIFSENEINSFIKGIEGDNEIINYINNKDNKESNVFIDIFEIPNNIEQKSTEDSEVENAKETIENIKIIGTHEKSAEAIIKTKDGFYASIGEQSLYLFDSSYEKIFELNNKNSGLFTDLQEMQNICENNKIELIATTQEEISLIKIDKKDMVYKKESNKICNSKHKSCIPIDNKNNIILCKEGVYHIKDFFSEITFPKTNKISEINCIGGIKISKDLIAITSNINIQGGEDKIIFYNPNRGKIIKEIEGYSFINSMNGLIILTCESGSGAQKKCCYALVKKMNYCKKKMEYY